MKHLFLTSCAAALLALSLAASAQQPPPGGPAVNSTVFSGDHIRAVTAVTKVFGRSQRIVAAIVEYDAPVANAALTAEAFAVTDRTITRVYANDAPVQAATGKDGRFVVIEMNPEDPSAVVYAPQVDTAPTVVVAQAQPVAAVDGQAFAPTETAIINTRLKALIVDDFRQFNFTDPETGLQLSYNLFIPKDYDPAQAYPMVLFMHDAGVTGTNPLRTLEQGLGAVAFASPEDQAKRPAFVLAPQYPVALANDASQISVYADITVRLIAALQQQYSLDEDRLYTTGQSGGCMTSIALNVKYPDLFAASLLVAGQWDPAVVAPLADHKIFAVVSQDDAKAYPGMTAIMDVLAQNGARITRAEWDGRASAEYFAEDVAKIRAEGADSNVFFVTFEKGTVIPEGESTQGAAGHVNTWRVAYTIAGLRDWLMEQSK